jgi:hypothetical protein
MGIDPLRVDTACCRKSKQQKRSSRPMGIFSKDIKSMNDLFVHTLRDIYYAEN